MHFLLFIDIMTNISRLDMTAKQSTVEYCREICSDNEVELAKIDRFEREYLPENIIWWYTTDSFFFRLLNNAIRVQDYDALFSLRLCIVDLLLQLEKEHKKFMRNYNGDRILRIYRGQRISNSEQNLISENVGGFISMNTFLSSSTDKNLISIHVFPILHHMRT
jgi:hypothetical protein